MNTEPLAIGRVEDSASLPTSRSHHVEVTILLPCLNEAASIQGCIEDAWIGLDRLGVIGEVLVSDNRSTDQSHLVATRAGARVDVATQRGYGAALRHGTAVARGEYVIIADADGSYDLTSLDGIWRRLQAGDHLVIGNRFDGHIASGAMPILHRYVGNPILSAIGRGLTKSTVGDFHSGMRGFRKSAIVSLQLGAIGMEYASEMIARASQRGLRISEVPINLNKARRAGGHSHLRPVRDGLRHLRILMQVRHGATVGPGVAVAAERHGRSRP